jgi:hypothetical protein
VVTGTDPYDRILGFLDREIISYTINKGKEGIPAKDNYMLNILSPIAVAERSKARTVFAPSNTAIMGSNPTEAWMFVCVLCAFFLFLHSLK